MPTIPPNSARTALTNHLRELNSQLRVIVDLARRLSAARSAPPAEITDAARRLRRFFEELWPLYRRDKEDTVARIEGRDGATDALIGQLRRGLQEQQVMVDRLLTLSRTFEETPARLEHHGDELAAVTAAFERLIDERLGEEERLLHPALIHLLSADDHHSLFDHLIARRGPPSQPIDTAFL